MKVFPSSSDRKGFWFKSGLGPNGDLPHFAWIPRLWGGPRAREIAPFEAGSARGLGHPFTVLASLRWVNSVVCGIGMASSSELYSSVHYTMMPNKSKANVRAEIQVRTLSEEIWGEVDHTFNYPHAVNGIACGEQIKVLARVASSCTRLVDSIFASYADWKKATEVTEGAADPGAKTAAAQTAPKAGTPIDDS